MESIRLGVLSMLSAIALAGQIAIVPLNHASGHSLLLWLVALLAPLCAALAVGIASSRPRTALVVMLFGVPAALGLFGLACLGQPLPRFDVPSRWIASVTAIGFFVVSMLWAHSLSPRIAMTHVRAQSPVAALSRAEPPLRLAGYALLAVMAWGVGAVLPVLASAHDAQGRSEILAGDRLVRARDSVTTAGGFLIAVMLVFTLGPMTVRRAPPPRYRATRGLAYLVWAAALGGLMFLLDRSR